MTDITFIRTRYYYGPYEDYFRLIELSGFPIIFVDELDVEQEGIFIVSPMNGEWRPHIDSQRDKTRKAKLVHWNLERPRGEMQKYVSECEELVEKGYIDHTVVSDRWLAQQTGFHFVPIGGHTGFDVIYDVHDRDYDFEHSCAYSYRRGFLFKEPGKPYRLIDNISIAPAGVWGAERLDARRRSRFTLAVHQDDDPIIEPLRWIAAAMYAMPILTETVMDAFPYEENKDFVQVRLDLIVSTMKDLRGQDKDVWFQRGIDLRNKMCGDYSFTKCLEMFL